MNSSSLWRLISHSHRASQRNHLVALHSHFFFSTKPKTLQRQQQQPEIAKYSTTTKTSSEFLRPTEIPFKSNVSNLVNLTGYVRSQVQLQTNSDGSPWAAIVISQNVSSSKDHHGNDDCEDGHDYPDALPLCVPVIFEGDLAHVAASHIKENDRVHVSGKLSSSLPHVNGGQVQASFQVVVHDINFIEKKHTQIVTELPRVSMKSKNVISDLSDSKSEDNDPVSSVWRDVIDNPREWFDNREAKKNRKIGPKFPDFKRKDGSQSLWLNRAPKSLLKELQGLEFGAQTQNPKEVIQSKGSDDLMLDSWEDLVNKTKEWRDYRNSKLNGQVNSKHPDFRRKDRTGQALWLNRAPKWFLSEVEGLEFDDVQVQNSKEVKDNLPEKKKEVQDSKGGDELWKDLVENPDQWWDNRARKTSTKAPDFKHKKTGEVLWLNRSTPAWALSKLPAPKSTENNSTKWKKYKED